DERTTRIPARGARLRVAQPAVDVQLCLIPREYPRHVIPDVRHRRLLRVRADRLAVLLVLVHQPQAEVVGIAAHLPEEAADLVAVVADDADIPWITLPLDPGGDGERFARIDDGCGGGGVLIFTVTRQRRGAGATGFERRPLIQKQLVPTPGTILDVAI